MLGSEEQDKEAAYPFGRQFDSSGWTPDWEPDAGWKTKENPTGWRKPKDASKQKELYLWDQWKQNGESREAIEPLMTSLRPLIYNYGVKQWAGRVPLQKPVLQAEANRLAISGLRKYDPNKAQINTFLGWQLQSMNRFVRQRQNVSRITEERAGLIGDKNRAFARLRDKLGREPTLLELADEMQRPVKTVEKLLQEERADLLASGAEENPFIIDTPKERRVLRLIRFELTAAESRVFDYITGTGTLPQIQSTNEIAKREGWTPSKVSQLKNSIGRKMRKYIE